MSDLEGIIEDSVNDAINEVDTPDVDTTSEAPELVETASEPTETVVEEPAQTQEVTAPAAQEEAPVEDPFSKLVGVPQFGISGRENRIPYSRVKKINEKAISEVAEAALGRKLNPGERAVDAVKAVVSEIPTLRSQVQDYEQRLNTVGEFENVMAQDPQRFLTMLSKIPAYKPFFDFLEQAASGQTPQGQAQSGQPAAPAIDPAAGMPEPDETLADGSKVYSMDGLRNLLAWNAQQVESRVTKQVTQQFEKRYGPIESDWNNRRRLEATIPIVRKQIEEAKTWPLFNESENEITEALRRDPNLTLEGAYRLVVFPKLVAERNKMRQDVIREVQAAPRATAVTSRAATKPTAPNVGPRSLEDIIKEQVETIR